MKKKFKKLFVFFCFGKLLLPNKKLRILLLTFLHFSAMKSWTIWFEIPAPDLERAKKFYETIFQMEVEVLDLGELKMGIFPHQQVGAALCQHPTGYQPSETHGVLVYLNANPDLNEVLHRVEAAGGKIIRPKTQISPEHGYMAVFIDSEGNRMALHSDS